LRVNKAIRADKVRVISEDGEQLGIMSSREALARAEAQGLDLVEISSSAVPPVCKIISYGKLRYHIAKKEKESKKSQHQVKIKEIKFKPNIDTHDFEVKAKHAREFLDEGNKVRLTCMFKGREMLHTELGEQLIKKMCDMLEDVATPEGTINKMGRLYTIVLAPGSKKQKVDKKVQGESRAEDENA
jgi:translation initiation factor IF-3